MPVLSFDISTGGVSAAIFNPDLKAGKVVEAEWKIDSTLTLNALLHTFREAAREIGSTARVDAVSIACFMHSIVALDRHDAPVSPVFTWLDRQGEEAVETFRTRLGREFHQRTGCRLHPIFPVFKLAGLRASGMHRAVSAKSVLLKELTGVWIEDSGMASASGMYSLMEDRWDDEILGLAGIRAESLAPVAGRNDIVGVVTPQAAAEFGIAAGTPVVNGSGDGLLANTGSGCDAANRMAITLGTSASARQSLQKAVLDESAGTFCYKADRGLYVLGCAGSNGGNVLDWGKSVLGGLDAGGAPHSDLPIFVPLLHGERSPDWNPRLTGTWCGLRSEHSIDDLWRSVIEGVVFNLVHYTEIIQRTSGVDVEQIVLSGNGFLNETAANILASLVSADALLLQEPGLASLRGAAMCAMRGTGENPDPAMEMVLKGAAVIAPIRDEPLSKRFQTYKKLRQEISDKAQ